jgi:hypothetical protein
MLYFRLLETIYQQDFSRNCSKSGNESKSSNNFYEKSNGLE